MATATEVNIRQSNLAEVKYLMELVEKQNWDYTMYDYWSYIRLDPEFLFVAIDKSGSPVGFGGINRNACDTMYLSSFIVREDLRQKGIGRQLWKALMNRAGDKNVALDGEPEMDDWYRKQGFVHQSNQVLFYTLKKTNFVKTESQSKCKIVSLKEDMWPSLMSYDKQVYPTVDREYILRAWFQGKDTRTVVALDAEKVIGYGSIHKKSENKYGLRNVFADNEHVFEALLCEMLQNIPDSSTVHFVLMDGRPLPKCLLASTYENKTTRRMYNKFAVEVNTEKIWMATARFL